MDFASSFRLAYGQKIIDFSNGRSIIHEHNDQLLYLHPPCAEFMPAITSKPNKTENKHHIVTYALDGGDQMLICRMI